MSLFSSYLYYYAPNKEVMLSIIRQGYFDAGGSLSSVYLCTPTFQLIRDNWEDCMALLQNPQALAQTEYCIVIQISAHTEVVKVFGQDTHWKARQPMYLQGRSVQVFVRQ